jgi:sugar lactone lactonase YvrE
MFFLATRSGIQEATLMRTALPIRLALSAGVALAVLAGCGGYHAQIAGPSVMPQSRTAPAPELQASSGKRNLYVLSSRFFKPHSSVKVYAPGNTKPLRSITTGISNPVAMAFDASGNLYVANSEILHGEKWGPATITVYLPGNGSPARTISNGVHSPGRMTFDRAGNLYAIMQGDDKKPESITVYAAGGTKVLRRITAGLSSPAALAFDQSGDLFVTNYSNNTITVYGPGKTSVLRTIDAEHPADLTFGRSGNLYVATEQGVYGRGTISVYLPGGSSPHRIISTTHGYIAGALTWDGSGQLYAIEQQPRDAYYAVVSGYAEDGKSLRTIPQDGLVPVQEAFDSSGNLYVADCPKSCNGTRGRDAVGVYAPGDRTPSRSMYITAPLALSFGP